MDRLNETVSVGVVVIGYGLINSSVLIRFEEKGNREAVKLVYEILECLLKKYMKVTREDRGNNDIICARGYGSFNDKEYKWGSFWLIRIQVMITTKYQEECLVEK